MSQKLLSILSIGAIALSAAIPTAIAQTAPRGSGDGTLKMVMVDQAQLSSSQRDAFQRYLQTANLPRTKVGKRCQYYGKPQVWCLLLDPAVAEQVYQKLSKQPFGSAADIQTVHRLKAPERS